MPEPVSVRAARTQAPFRSHGGSYLPRWASWFLLSCSGAACTGYDRATLSRICGCCARSPSVGAPNVRGGTRGDAFCRRDHNLPGRGGRDARAQRRTPSLPASDVVAMPQLRLSRRRCSPSSATTTAQGGATGPRAASLSLESDGLYGAGAAWSSLWRPGSSRERSLQTRPPLSPRPRPFDDRLAYAVRRPRRADGRLVPVARLCPSVLRLVGGYGLVVSFPCSLPSPPTAPGHLVGVPGGRGRLGSRRLVALAPADRGTPRLA